MTDKYDALRGRVGPAVPDNSMVICPQCTSQFVAISVKDQAERDALRAQLPGGMEHCTIQFKECEKGHGWLTAKNWTQHGCPWCERNALRADAERYRWLRAQDSDGDITACNWTSVKFPSEQPYTLRGDDLDAAIDSARGKP